MQDDIDGPEPTAPRRDAPLPASASDDASPPANNADPPAAPLYTRDFFLACLVLMMSTICWGLMFNFASTVRYLGKATEWFTVDAFVIGLIMGLPALVVLPLWPYVGTWLDRVRVVPLWMAGLAFMGLSIGAFLLLPQIGLPQAGGALYILRGCLLLGWAIASTAASSYVALIAPPGRQAEAIGSLGIGGFIGIGIGSGLGSQLLSLNTVVVAPDAYLPPLAERIDGQWAPHLIYLAIAGATAFFAAALAAFLTKPSVEQSGRSLHPWRTLLQNPPGLVILIPFAVSFAFMGTSVFMRVIGDTQGFEPTPYYIAFPIVAGLVRILGRRLFASIDTARLAIAGVVFYSLPWIVLTQVATAADPTLLLVIAGGLGGLGHGVLFPCMVELVARRQTTENRSLGTSVALGVAESGPILVAPLLGATASYFGNVAMLLTITAALLILGGIGVVNALRHPKRGDGAKAA